MDNLHKGTKKGKINRQNKQKYLWKIVCDMPYLRNLLCYPAFSQKILAVFCEM